MIRVERIQRIKADLLDFDEVGQRTARKSWKPFCQISLQDMISKIIYIYITFINKLQPPDVTESVGYEASADGK